MYGDAYFGPRFWANDYWGPAAVEEPEPPGDGGDRHETTWGVARSYLLRTLLLMLVT